MTWNYRVCRTRFEKFDPELHSPEDEFSFSIHEVYYTTNGDIRFTSVDPMSPYGTTVAELTSDFEIMKEAFEKDVLDLDSIVYVDEDDEGA